MNLLELSNITKYFGAIHALVGVDLSVKAGEVVGLMGDNGAGKSTLMKIVAGNYPPTEGRISIEGREVSFSEPVDAREAGIEIVYQDLALCDNLTASPAWCCSLHPTTRRCARRTTIWSKQAQSSEARWRNAQ